MKPRYLGLTRLLARWGCAAVTLLPGGFAAADQAWQNGPDLETLRIFADVFQAIKNGYVDPIDDKKLMEFAIRGMLGKIDADSTYLDGEAWSAMQKGQAGIGVSVGMHEGLLKVVEALEGGPAARGGIQKGDLIARIDGRDVRGMTLAEATTRRLAGRPGTPVTLTVLRPGEAQPLTIELQREFIRIRTVRSGWLKTGYAYLQIRQFSSDTLTALAEHGQQLFNQAPVQGIVLDLRNNEGGLLASAIGTSAAFLPQGSLVVFCHSRYASANRPYHAKPEDYLKEPAAASGDPLQKLPPAIKKVPMVVLIDGGSAAGAEVVAGALQDHKRAVIVGMPSFGRASIQTVMPLGSTAAIKLTTATWTTPHGRNVHGAGLTPDIRVPEIASTYRQGVLADDPALRRALEVLEARRETADITKAVVNLQSCKRPEYPSESVRAGEAGLVVLGFLVSTNGKVVQSKVFRSSGHPRLDATALEALATCTFTPAIRAGRFVESWAKIEYEWRLDDDISRKPPLPAMEVRPPN